MKKMSQERYRSFNHESSCEPELCIYPCHKPKNPILPFEFWISTPIQKNPAIKSDGWHPSESHVALICDG